MKCKKLIDPILIECQRVFIEQETFKRTLEEYSKWTHSSLEIIEVFDEICLDPVNKVVETILRLTSLLEFALGNVYKTFTGRLPPHLFKELLQELAGLKIFEPNQVILKIKKNKIAIFFLSIFDLRFLFCNKFWDHQKESI